MVQDHNQTWALLKQAMAIDEQKSFQTNTNIKIYIYRIYSGFQDHMRPVLLRAALGPEDVFGMSSDRFWRLEGGLDDWIAWAAQMPHMAKFWDCLKLQSIARSITIHDDECWWWYGGMGWAGMGWDRSDCNDDGDAAAADDDEEDGDDYVYIYTLRTQTL